MNALHCLLSAGRWVPQKYRDLVLISLGSVYLEMGYFDEAMAAAEESFRLSLYEVCCYYCSCLNVKLTIIKKSHIKYIIILGYNKIYTAICAYDLYGYLIDFLHFYKLLI